MYNELSKYKKMNQRKYRYPSYMIRKNGKLMKNRKKQILYWRNNIKKNYLNVDKYTDLIIENKQLNIENTQCKDALCEWVLLYQSLFNN